MKLNKDKMINLFLKKIEVSENELDKARNELLKAYRLINIQELSDINKELLNHNLKPFDFEIDYHRNDASKIVVDDGNIYFQNAIDVSFNHNYFILNIYSFDEDDVLNMNTTKLLVLKNAGAIGYVKFLNGERLEGKRIYTFKKEKELTEMKKNLENVLNNKKQLSRVLFKNN